MDHVYPNKWSKFRENIKEPFAEFLGICILVIFGTGVNCQVVLSSDTNVVLSPRGDSLAACFGWAAGIALGVWVSGGISGGHINPAVTLAMAVFRGFPWKKVPVYIFAQTLGGIVGAAVVYGNYFHAIDLFEGHGVRTLKTAGLFATYSLDYMTSASSFFNEFLGTALLILTIFAITDKNNMPMPNGLVPLGIFIALLGISAALGMQTAFAINPARDFGPRVLTAMAGYGKEVFTYRHAYWIWCPIFGPFLGALFGAAVYDVFLYTGEDSITNKGFRKPLDDLATPI